MSNCLAVLIKNKIHYYPLRWEGKTLQVWNDKEWLNVTPTSKRINGQLIFEPVSAIQEPAIPSGISVAVRLAGQKR
jgi:hypothetical protein